MDLNNFLQATIWVKIIALITIGFYIVFTLVVFTQVKTMTQILHLPHGSKILKTISIAHIALAISLFLIAVVIL